MHQHGSPSDYTITRTGDSVGTLVLGHEGRQIGRLDFHASATVIEIDYVVVDPSRQGQGLGARLVDAAVAWARDTGRTVRPYCGYAAKVLRDDSRYQDVLTPP